VLAVADGAALIAKAKAAGVPARRIGIAAGGDLVLPDGTAISVLKLTAAHEATLPALMGEN
jgi:phosphoribosylformylglycinamidine synthase